MTPATFPCLSREKVIGLPLSRSKKRVSVSGNSSPATGGSTSQVGHLSSADVCAKTNPTGLRCDIYDHAVNVFGRDPKTGFARRPLDNVGIQYGLGALNAGKITTGQFLDVNEKIGGFDIDGNMVAERMVADPIAVRAAYRTGRVNQAQGGMGIVPIIDYRTYYDDLPGGDVHMRFQQFTTDARLLKATGTTDNRVMLTQDRRYGAFDTKSPELRQAIVQPLSFPTRPLSSHSFIRSK